IVACGKENTEDATKGNTDAESVENGSGDGGSYNFKLGHIAPPEHIWNETAEKLAEELEERSDGRMTLELYPGGQLGSDADMVQQLETGSLDFGFITNTYLASKSESFSAWYTPFIFDSYEEALEARDSEVAQKILDTLDDHGLKGLNYFFSGHRTIMANQKAETPEEIKGLSFRVAPGPALEDWYRLIGASPESISLPEVYQSLE